MKRTTYLSVVCLTAAGLFLVGCGSNKTAADTTVAPAASATETTVAPASEAGADTTATPDSAAPTTVAAVAASPAKGDLEVFSWWTSGSEHAALQKLFDTVQGANPGLKAVDAAVSGGAGTNAKQVLATRLSSGDIPATWQTHAGGALGDYVKQGVVNDLSDLYKTEGWASVLPKTILDSLTVDGKIYAVPAGVHRGNNMFYNKAVLDKVGVTLTAATSWADFEAAAVKIKAAGVAPLCLGDKDVWTDATLLENLIIPEVGAEGWNGLLTGKVKWTDPKVSTAIEHFKTARSWAQADHQALDWTGAVAALAEGKCAFNSMGDWEYGELLVKQEKVDGKDFGATVIGDSGLFVTVTDVFVAGKGSKNQDGAVAWLKALMDTKAQLEFNQLKGSSPARNDVDVSTSGPVGQTNAKALASGTLVPSLVQDQANIPPAISAAMSDAVTLLVSSGDGAAFSKAMDEAIAAG